MSHQDREQKRPIQTEFVRSVDELSPEDIHSNERKKGILSALFENSRSIMLFFCCALLIFSVCYVGNSISHYIEADSVYSNTAEMMNGGSSLIHQMYSPSVPIATPDYSASQTLTKDDIDNIGSSGVVNKDYERIRSRLTSMKAEYPNLYGWITIPNTNIDLPVMQTDDNDYYLNHAYNDKYLSAGAIFVDYRCDS